ncbi:MAG: phosphodiester glycosidase family protein [Gemmatimonas sp.]
MRGVVPPRALLFVLALAISACVPAGRRNSPWRIAPTVADTITTETIAPGVRLHRLVQNSAPWRAFVLDVDLSACVSIRSVKGDSVALGRRTTSALLGSLNPRYNPVAAVNADFFLFAPPGIPVGAHVEAGRLVSGPVARPVFGMLKSGAPWIGVLTVRVTMSTPRGTTVMTSWNRPTRAVAGLVDGAWGAPLDTTITRPVWRLVPIIKGSDRYVAAMLDSTASRVARGDTVFVVELPVSQGEAPLRTGDTVAIARNMTPESVEHTVGGFPLLLRDSAITDGVETASNAAFRGVNPRTAVGVGANGRRVLIAVIDGRQARYSAGMTLRETATLLRDLGAREGINLDGGGSSAMVFWNARAERQQLQVVNKPSDAVGERPVANALAIVRGCGKSQVAPR